MDKRPLLVTAALAAVIALAGCGNGTAGSVGTDTPTPSASTSATPSSPAPTTPGATDTPVPGAAWTAETAYDACLAFHREKTTADGFDPDASTWNPFTPEVARQNGADWTVDLIGTVKGDDGETYDGVFSCLVSGTPAAPDVSEFTAG
jgi:hypothetical protein